MNSILTQIFFKYIILVKLISEKDCIYVYLVLVSISYMSAEHLYKKGNKLFFEEVKMFERRKKDFFFSEGHTIINNTKIF
jgi:hypothetical protein